MDQVSAGRPPTLDCSGNNYSLWKSRMKMFIKSLDEHVWLSVLNGWCAPCWEVNNEEVIKLETEWNADERAVSNFNSKALNAIFISVDVGAFRLISNCVQAREAWLILQEHCEGSESVKATKLRHLTTRFENLRMEEDESITSYAEKIGEISNEAVALGEPISNERLVSKIMRSLPEKFNIKISAIEEAKDLTKLRVSELMSILTTFEMNLDQQKKHVKGKSMAFKRFQMMWLNLTLLTLNCWMKKTVQ